MVHGRPLGQDDEQDEESLRHFIDSPTYSDSSFGSYSPLREIFMVSSPTESGLKCQHNDECRQHSESEKTERQHLEEEARSAQEKEAEHIQDLQTTSHQLCGDVSQI